MTSSLSEQEIRPPDLIDGQRIALMSDIGRLLSRYDQFVQVGCPSCRADESSHQYSKNGFTYVSCSSCATMYVNPRPSPELLDWFYEGSLNYAYWNNYIFPASESARREKIFVPRVDRLIDTCRRLGVSMGSLLEVGAGFGTFCAELQTRDAFSRIVGVEPTPDLASTCRERGVEVIEKPIEKIDLDGDDRFDVVASFEVIEHLFDPAAFLQQMSRLLKLGGLMMLTCPNGQGFDIEALGPVSSSVDHEHLNYFNPESLAHLVRSTGLEVIESSTPGKLDAELVRNAVLAGEYSLDEQPLLRRILIDRWDQLGASFQSYLIDANMSSNLWIVAQKADESDDVKRNFSR